MVFTYSATTVNIPGSLYGESAVRHLRKQNRLVAEDNTVYVYDRTAVSWFVEVNVICTATTMLELRNFFKNTVSYSKLAFTFTPDAAMNAGGGAGVAVTVRLWQDDIAEKYIAPGRFKISFLLRASSVGSGTPS